MTKTDASKQYYSLLLWPTFLIIIFGFTLSFGLYFYTYNHEKIRNEENHEQYIHVQNLRIQAMIEQSKMVLKSYYGLFNSKERVTRDEYRFFSNIALTEHPEIFAVHWSPKIKHKDRNAVELTLKQLSLAPLGIFDVSPDAGKIERAPIRKEYFPIIYAEPLDKNRKAVGLDPLARPYNTKTIREAARNGTRDTTPPFPIVQDPNGPLSVAIYHPIYEQNQQLNTPNQRWSALKGYIILMLRPGILLEEYHQEFIQKGVSVRLLDVTDKRSLKIFPKADSLEDLAISALKDPKVTRYSWQIPGREWMLEFYSRPDAIQAQKSYLPRWLLAIMLLLTLVLASFIFNSIRQSEKLKRANLDLIERQKELDDLAYYDQLTRLPNRSLLNEHLKRILKLEEREDSFSAICVMDLDGFKEINDLYGHDAGDLVLKEVATRLLDKLRDSDVASRVGGDEFVFILTGLHLLAPIDEIINRIIEAIGEPILLADNHNQIQVSASIGVSLSKTHITQQLKPNKHPISDRLQETDLRHKAEIDNNKRKILLKNADIAMYQAKKQGKAKHILFQGDV
jgi:diguanylate cyclase (GGDEF)-like protein